MAAVSYQPESPEEQQRRQGIITQAAQPAQVQAPAAPAAPNMMTAQPRASAAPNTAGQWSPGMVDRMWDMAVPTVPNPQKQGDPESHASSPVAAQADAGTRAQQAEWIKTDAAMEKNNFMPIGYNHQATLRDIRAQAPQTGSASAGEWNEQDAINQSLGLDNWQKSALSNAEASGISYDEYISGPTGSPEQDTLTNAQRQALGLPPRPANRPWPTKGHVHGKPVGPEYWQQGALQGQQGGAMTTYNPGNQPAQKRDGIITRARIRRDDGDEVSDTIKMQRRRASRRRDRDDD